MIAESMELLIWEALNWNGPMTVRELADHLHQPIAVMRSALAALPSDTKLICDEEGRWKVDR